MSGADTADTEDLVKWWRLFGDSTLTSLVERAFAQGLDLRFALARVEEARAVVGVVTGEIYPSLGADADYTRSRPRKVLGQSRGESGSFSVGLGASWEIDLFGRIRRSVEASEADLGAAVEDFRAVRVAIAAEVALAYIDVRAFQERVRVAQANIAAQIESLDIAQQRVTAGLATEIDEVQAASNVATSEARLPPLQEGLRLSIFRLSVLLGQAPGALLDELSVPAPLPRPHLVDVMGVPADILKQRPDIRAAERRLAASTARIGVAEAARYPQIALFGSLRLDGRTLADTLSDAAMSYAFGPSVNVPLFQGGSLRAGVAMQEARREQAYANLELTVLEALRDVESSRASYESELARRDAIEQATTQFERTVELAQARYRGGEDDFESVLIAQRSLFAAEDQLVDSRARVLGNIVALYRALGGGWE